MRSVTEGGWSALYLSLVHPDFLAPIYAVAASLQEHGARVRVLSFSSPAPGASTSYRMTEFRNAGPLKGNAFSRWRARRTFGRLGREMMDTERPDIILASCPFSFLSALRLSRGRIPVIYHAFELYDFGPADFWRSPATTVRSWLTLRKLSHAALVCTPSAERSGWLAGRARLAVLPTTVLNVPFGGLLPANGDSTALEGILPGGTRGRSIVLNSGAVNASYAVVELVRSVEHWSRNACLIVTRVEDSAYATQVRRAAEESPRREDILLLPMVTRAEMLALQSAATLGACFIRPTPGVPETLMPAPNKVGEYLQAGLPIVGSWVPYLDQLQAQGVAVLANHLDPQSIARAVNRALDGVDSARKRVAEIANGWYRMETQVLPILEVIDSRRRRSG
ncbi:MAG: glycosyltransferase [Gemmatimonadota bacterium]|nr:glycosyltransferase [Gemmatimonadota bacterium]